MIPFQDRGHSMTTERRAMAFFYAPSRFSIVRWRRRTDIAVECFPEPPAAETEFSCSGPLLVCSICLKYVSAK
jgi:hypothetical protein